MCYNINMRYKPYAGKYPLSAGYRYSNGKLHAAYDVAMPIGTPLYSPMDGIVLDCNDGVHNNRPGEAIWSNKPSNWVLLGFVVNGQKYGFYSQHMSPGLKVRKGQKVKSGQLIGYSGNSGNSSGPHWHNSAQKSWSLNRYLYLVSSSDRVYPPSKLWGEEYPDSKVAQKYPGRKAARKARKHGAPWVSKVKRSLKKRGYHIDKVDDVYSKDLVQALKKFKRKHKLGVTGTIGKRAWTKLNIRRNV